MTREQIEAWLILEGWRATNCRRAYHIVRELVVATDHQPIKLAPKNAFFNGDFDAEWHELTDGQVQLIYQEITKHDT